MRCVGVGLLLRSVFRSSVIPPSAGSRSRRCWSRSRRADAAPRAFSLGLDHRRRLLRRHALLDHPRDGGLRRPADRGSRCSINAALIAYLALFPALFAVVVRRARASRSGRAALMAAPFVWVATELGRTHLLHRVSLGAARLQPGHDPADRAAREPVRRLRRVGARGGGQRGAACRGWRRRRRRLQSGRSRGAAGRRRWSSSSRSIAVAVWGSRRAADGRVDARGRADPRRSDSGQRRSGARSGTRRAPRDLSGLPAHDAAGDRARAPSSCSGPSRRRRSCFDEDLAGGRAGARAGAAGAGADPRSAAIRSSAATAADEYYNSAFLVRPDGTTGGVYRKMHLVPFGEYVPLKQLLFFAAPLVEAVVRLLGRRATPTLLPVGGHSISTAICYEVVYPGSRPAVRRRRQRAADDDHQRRVVRARRRRRISISRRRRCARSRRAAIWCAPPTPASAASSIRTAACSRGREIFEPAVIVGEARFLRTSTLYARCGDVFAYASVVATVRRCCIAVRRDRQTPGAEPSGSARAVTAV